MEKITLYQIDIPSFKLIARGNSIDEKEFNVITHSAVDSLKAREDPLSNGIIKRIKKEIGGEWIVFAHVEELKGYDFSITFLTGNDFLSFVIQKFLFRVYKI